VAALFFTDVGPVSAAAADEQAEPKSSEQARAVITDHINRLRSSSALVPVVLDPALSQVAQDYSDRMSREHFFAHVAPDGTTVAERLRASGYAYATAGENLAQASGPLAAHFGLEHSPGHRQNLIGPAFRRLGIGISPAEVDGQKLVVLTEILAAPVSSSGDPLADAYQGLKAKRTTLHLPALRRSAVLEALAHEQAQEALNLDDPKTDLTGRPLHERVFSSVPDVRHTTADLYVTQDLLHLPESKSVADRANDLVGIGAVRGDSARFGKNRYWVVVIYAGTQE
jgi:uncharacterized protein YkwD